MAVPLITPAASPSACTSGDSTVRPSALPSAAISGSLSRADAPGGPARPSAAPACSNHSAFILSSRYFGHRSGPAMERARAEVRTNFRQLPGSAMPRTFAPVAVSNCRLSVLGADGKMGQPETETVAYSATRHLARRTDARTIRRVLEVATEKNLLCAYAPVTGSPSAYQRA